METSSEMASTTFTYLDFQEVRKKEKVFSVLLSWLILCELLVGQMQEELCFQCQISTELCVLYGEV